MSIVTADHGAPVRHKGFTIEIRTCEIPEAVGHMRWVAGGNVWFHYGGRRIDHELDTTPITATEKEAENLALDQARAWIDLMGNPKAALEDATFGRLVRQEDSHYDCVLTEFYDPSHPIPSASALPSVQRQLLQSVIDTNWRRMRHIFSIVRPESGERILDAGCGYGGLTFLFSKSGALVVGLERSLSRLIIGRRISSSLGIATRLCQGDCVQLPFPEGTFDKVLSSNVFEHLIGEQRSMAIVEIGRILKPGGAAYIYTDNRIHVLFRLLLRRILLLLTGRNPMGWKLGFSGAPGGHGDLMTAGEAIHLLKKNGFIVKKKIYSMPFTPLGGFLLSKFFCLIAAKPALDI